jgi:ABC-type glycerol-3-phosphate transport system substrate-binding protein
VNDFQAKHPWIRIELVKADRFSDDLTTRVRNKQVDVFRGYRSALGLAQEGLLKPVDELVGDEWSTTRGDYFEGTWGGLSVQGRQWGIPAGVDMMMTYVNKDQLAALKLDTPGTDWDLFEFLSLAHDMNYPDGVPYGDDIKLFGFCTSPDSVDPVVLISLHGGKIVDDIYSPTVATLDAPLTVEAVQTYTSPGLNTVGSSLYEAIQKILARDLGVEDAMSEAQSKCGSAFRNP